ncbi:DUF86 domain-containing protein [Nitratiruptor sp. YY08-13]|uniref:type VII toxin-antitoxin system HepT family RNase toxin n=1 Tax=Nitratiruptor sp. YY08-13 TaxID=2724898 RepID=UPI001F3ECB74|nr:HepT-like ribonuclease domain-containing protein [Nitratiruptor sp. YY08-13]
MSLHDYLEQIKKRAIQEKRVLDILASKEKLDEIELRAAKNSLQVMIEMLIGKSKKILKFYNCPVVPTRSKDAVYILHEVGAIEDEEYREFNAAIGFRNVLIHDYLEFDEDILYKLLKSRQYEKLYDFLQKDIDFFDVVIKRIERFAL